MMKIKNDKKGITLISIIITVILLIILAGISINAILGENGIITIAKQAKENVELSQIEEQTELNELYTQMKSELGTSEGISYDAIAKLAEFKKIIADAITNKGVATSQTDTVQTMAENIKNISSGDITELAVEVQTLKSEFAQLKNETKTIGEIYPVGNIYISVDGTDPSTLFGGTWEQIKDTFLLSAGDTYTAGTTGGEAEHTLTIAEMPSHNHTMTVTGFTPASWTKNALAVTGTEGAHGTSYVGGSQAHNNMPPYLTVYMWKRIA